MYLPTTCILLLLCIGSLITGAVGCEQHGTGNCQFVDEATLCGWTLGGNFQLNSTLGGFIQLVRGSDTGSLTSRTACSTGGETHCFRFSYQFDVDNILTLSVSITFGLNESLLWILSSGGLWNEASVPIATNHDFNVIFKAKRHCGQHETQGSVRIDVIRYEKLTTNSCSFQPPTASPTSLPAIPSSCNITSPLPSTTQEMTLSHETITRTTGTASFQTSSLNGGSEQIRISTNPTTTTTNETVIKSTPDDYFNRKTLDGAVQQTIRTRAGTQFPSSVDSGDDVSELSHNAGIIAGSVLAGVAIIGTVTLVVLVRQKKIHFRKHCFGNKHQKRQAQDDDGYEIPLPKTISGNNTETASRRENEGTRDTVSGTDTENSRDHALTQPSGRVRLPLTIVANNYDCLDFTNSEQDGRVYASLNAGFDHRNSPSQPGLYEALGERRDSHLYGHTPGASPVHDSCVYCNVVES